MLPNPTPAASASGKSCCLDDILGLVCHNERAYGWKFLTKLQRKENGRPTVQLTTVMTRLPPLFFARNLIVGAILSKILIVLQIYVKSTCGKIRNLKRKMGAMCWEQCRGWNTNDLIRLVVAIVGTYHDTSFPSSYAES